MPGGKLPQLLFRASLRQWLRNGGAYDRRADRDPDRIIAGAAAGPIMRAPARVAGRLSPRARARYAPG